MNLRDLIVLLPCQSLDSLPLDQNAQQAEGILAAWSSLYHPSLLASAKKPPRWVYAESPPEDIKEALIVIPEVSVSAVPSGWVDQAREAGARVIEGVCQRDAILAAALEGVEPSAASVAPTVIADFLALGFCHFQVEMVTQKLRYSSSLDQERFGADTLAAAEAVFQGDSGLVEERLRAAYDRLIEARQYYYPTENHLLDLTLVASTTVGETLRQELACGHPLNLLISGEVLDQMARREPESLARLREALTASQVTVLGGEYEEHELPLLTLEEVLIEFRRGLAVYERHLGARPTVFGRRRFGLTPILPQVLKKLGFTGALHVTLDDGQFPAAKQSKIQWEGLDGSEIESLANIPLVAAEPEGYLNIAEKLSGTVEMDHTSMVLFAHWPGQTSPWYEDFRRIAHYSTVLGRFATIGTYLQDTYLSGGLVRPSPDEYRSPYLRQEVSSGGVDPISRWVRHHRHRAALAALQAAETMAEMAQGAASDNPSLPQNVTSDNPSTPPMAGTDDTPPPDEALSDEAIAERLADAAARLAQTLSRPSGAAVTGYLVVNPSSAARRMHLDVSALEALPRQAIPVRLATESEGRKEVLVDVPAMGFAWIGPATGQDVQTANTTSRQVKESPPLAEEHLLRNEYFQAMISPTTGGIQALHNYAVRGNRLAQQIGLRLTPAKKNRAGWTDAGDEKHYTTMEADAVEILSPGPMVGCIRSRGRLMDRQGELVARFVQTMEARRGSRILDLVIELELERQPGPDPWNSYYGLRLAWLDEAAEVSRGVAMMTRRTESAWPETPYFFDLRTARTRFAMFVGGLPYHRRFGARRLDHLLVVQGETCRRFHIGLGVDLTHPAAAAMNFLAPHAIHRESAAPPSHRSGWLFHIDRKNVQATSWEPLGTDDQITGLRVRLVETEGRSARTGLRLFQSPTVARKMNFLGQDATLLQVDDDRVSVDLGPHEWVQVEVDFTEPVPTESEYSPYSEYE